MTSGDVCIRDARIAAVGSLSPAERKCSIDARNLVVAPGFIDMPGQSEMAILVEPHLPPKIYQGINHGNYRRRRFSSAVE
jgi:N-acyl-D-amino-acid deacylase